MNNKRSRDRFHHAYSHVISSFLDVNFEGIRKQVASKNPPKAKKVPNRKRPLEEPNSLQVTTRSTLRNKPQESNRPQKKQKTWQIYTRRAFDQFCVDFKLAMSNWSKTIKLTKKWYWHGLLISWRSKVSSDSFENTVF